MFAKRNITSPIGTATATALFKTETVFVVKARHKTRKISGFLYGGSSSVNDDVSPLSIVFDNIFETKNVENMLNSIISKNTIIPFIELHTPSFYSY